MTVASLTQRRYERAERALIDAGDDRALEIAWAAHGNAFPEGSPEHETLLGIYEDQHARFAVELAKLLRV